jgi:LMBR1 domain-containing protein 1
MCTRARSFTRPTPPPQTYSQKHPHTPFHTHTHTQVLIPFAYFWYETDDDESFIERLGTAVCWSIVSAFLFIALLLGLYMTSGFVDLKITVLLPYINAEDPLNIHGDIGFFDPKVTKPPSWNAVKDMGTSSATQTIQTSWMVYILALLSFLGWCLMTIFAGIGMVSLPMDMIGAWYNRPRPIDLKQFAGVQLA